MHKHVAGLLGAALCAVGVVGFAPGRAAADGGFVTQGESWRQGSGYVAGSFAVTEGNDVWAFGLVDGAGREHLLPFVRGKGPEPQISLVAVPPGDYRVLFWKVTHENRRQGLSRHDPLRKPFAVQPGHVVFLGKFDAISREIEDPSSGWRGTRFLTWNVDRREIGADEAWTQFRGAFARFAEAPLECLLCTPAPAGATNAAAPAPAQGGQFSAKHQVKIHFHRASGDYEDTRLAAWGAYEGDRPREVFGATRSDPAKWNRDDAFGVRWVVSDLNFQDGTVHFLLFEGKKELQRREFGWSLADGRQAWVVEGDKNVYTRLEDALAALPKEEAEAILAEDPKPSTGPEVIVHFHRADGYENVRLRAWTGGEGKPRTYVAGTSPERGVAHDGFPGGFGARWELGEKAFPTGKVSFSVSGTVPELEWSFSLADAHEVWVNAGDPEVYLSKEEAQDAQDE